MVTTAVSSTPPFVMTPDHAEFYRRNGYLVAEQAVTPQQIEALRHETARICRGEYGDFNGLAVADSQETDDQVLQRYLCIHFPHKISPVMAEALAYPSTVDVLTSIIGPDVKCMQSMLFIKAAGKPGQAWHQDEYYIPTRDRSLVGGWIALDDATVENGCLWVIPGSHQPGIIWPTHEHDDARFDCAIEAIEFPYTDDDSIPVEVKAGSIVFFNGYLLHRSLPNRAQRGYRRALVNHYMSAHSLLPWGSDTKGEPISQFDYRDIVMVAGKDPYAYKGTRALARAHVRRSREGGCAQEKTDSPRVA